MIATTAHTRTRVVDQAIAEGKEVNAEVLDSLLRRGALLVDVQGDGRFCVRVHPELYALCREVNRRAQDR